MVNLMRDDFGILIMSHGRADKMKTVDMLREYGYTGKWYILIDNEDKTADEYYKRYGEHVIMFDKVEISKRIDTMDITNNRKVILFARCACFEVAKNLGLKYFLEFDDDYKCFSYRHESKNELKQSPCRNLDKAIDIMIDFLEDTNAETVAFAQGGDFVGGLNSNTWKMQLKRKAMNTFFCRTDRYIDFVGTINEDVNMYVNYGMRGKLVFTTALLMINQEQTQKTKGGMTEIYEQEGTYLKSFYSVMTQPSCVKIAQMGNTHKRFHHHVLWDYCTPMIINEKYKKKTIKTQAKNFEGK